MRDTRMAAGPGVYLQECKLVLRLGRLGAQSHVSIATVAGQARQQPIPGVLPLLIRPDVLPAEPKLGPCCCGMLQQLSMP